MNKLQESESAFIGKVTALLTDSVKNLNKLVSEFENMCELWKRGRNIGKSKVMRESTSEGEQNR